MSFKIWVQYGDSQPVKVNFSGGDVDDLKEAVKAKLKPDLDDVAVNNFTLREHDEEEELRGDFEINSNFITTYDEPLELLVAEPSHGLKRKFEEETRDTLAYIKQVMQKNDKGTVAISKVSRGDVDELLNTLGLKLVTIKYDIDPATSRISKFQWITNRTESNQKEEYKEWLVNNIDLPKDVELFDTSANRSTLNTQQKILPFKIKGTIDMVVVDKKNIAAQTIVGGIRLGIEVKKEVIPANVGQAVLELVSANIYSEYPVAIVLTNLGKIWQFFWLEEGKVITCVLPIRKAKSLIEKIVWDAPEVAAGNVESELESHNNRCNMLQVMTGGAVSGRTSGEPEGLERVLRRPKVDLMRLLPEDDIARMQDVFDVMSPEEVLDWKQRRLLSYFEQTPALQSCLST